MASHFDEIPFVQSGHAVAEVGAVAIQRIGRNPAEGQVSTPHGRLEQSQRQLRLGVEGEVWRHTTLSPFFGMGVVKPVFEHEELSIYERVALAAGITEIHA